MKVPVRYSAKRSMFIAPSKKNDEVSLMINDEEVERGMSDCPFLIGID